MRRCLVVLALCLCVGCSSSPATRPSSPVSSGDTTPTQRRTTARAEPNQTITPATAVTQAVASPIPTPLARPTTPPTATPNPEFVANVERRFDVADRQPLAWSPDGRSLLLGNPGIELVRYPLGGEPPVTVLDDRRPGIYFAQVRPAWDWASDLIIAPRWESATSFAIVALTPDGGEQQRLVSDIVIDGWWASLRPHLLEVANAAPVSVFDVAIASDGTVGELLDGEVLRRRAGQPDELIPLPPQVHEALRGASPAAYHSLWLAPQGGRLAVTVEAQIFLFGPTPTNPLVIVTLPELGGRRPVLPLELVWSPDGQVLALRAADVNGDIGNFVPLAYLVDQATGALASIAGVAPDGTERLPYISGNSRSVAQIAWSPDGRWLLLGRPNEEQCDGAPAGCNASQTVLDPATGRARLLWLALGGSDALWSPDGSQLAVTCGDAHNITLAHLCVLTLTGGWETALR